MSESRPNLQTWAAGLLFLGLAGIIGYSLPRPENSKTLETSTPKGTNRTDKGAQAKQAFTPPRDDEIPDDDFGKMIRLGSDIFHDTQNNAKEFVGNALQCANCHIDRGRLANSAPLWAAYVAYPAYRDKNGHVNTFQERVQGCFRYSMNGKAPPLGDNVLVAIETYAYFLAKGAPTGVDLPGRGYPKLPKPASLDYGRGAQVYARKCAVCHGATEQGQTSSDGTMVFPPLWGERSYNWGAGMSSISNAAGFIKANMPLSQGNTLSDQEAWDVATFIDSQERPQDPRFSGSVADTRKKYHDSPMSMYGQLVNGVVLGQNGSLGARPRE
ncbi:MULTISPECIES: c-type cytochrome [unclassified Afipia]|uniref:c-type cytochrome n=1 Tax=unclassified Afipia TaxID=2642050 RepID=UPI000462F478|nr:MULTISPECIES: c-type cytochrome [unclassified Afipia]